MGEREDILLKYGADIDALLENKCESLIWASKYGYLEIVKFLTKNKARCEIDLELLHNIIRFDKKEILKELVTNGSTILPVNNKSHNTEISSLHNRPQQREEINKILRENEIEFDFGCGKYPPFSPNYNWKLAYLFPQKRSGEK